MTYSIEAQDDKGRWIVVKLDESKAWAEDYLSRWRIERPKTKWRIVEIPSDGEQK